VPDSLGARVLKVNHAGEHGAVNIYAGQALIARFTAPSVLPELAEFMSHEKSHRQIFWQEMQRRQIRRCRSYLLCGIGGYLLGMVTGLFGSDAIAATTVAVERVVLGHLDHQLTELRGVDEGTTTAIEAIIADERRHHDESASRLPTSRFWLRLLSPVVGCSTEAVIWIGMHV
jgi:ubiquinone biosynthesis monooxygenase Coq7